MRYIRHTFGLCLRLDDLPFGMSKKFTKPTILRGVLREGSLLFHILYSRRFQISKRRGKISVNVFMLQRGKGTKLCFFHFIQELQMR